MWGKPGRMLIGPGRPYDLIVICLLVAVAVLLSIYQAYGPATWALGFLAVFFCPGYAIVSALFPGQREVLSYSKLLNRKERIYDISILERVTLSVAIGAAAVGLVGTVLTRGLLSLNTLSVGLETAIITYFFAAVAVYRRTKLPAGDQFQVRTRPRPAQKVPPTSYEKGMAVLIVASVLVLGAVAVNGLHATPAAEPFVEFSITGADGNMEHLPQRLSPNQQGQVTVGVISHLGSPQAMTLTLHLESASSSATPFNPSSPVALTPGTGRSTTFDLADGQTWETTITFTIPTTGTWTLYLTLDYGTEEKVLWMPLTVT